MAWNDAPEELVVGGVSYTKLSDRVGEALPGERVASVNTNAEAAADNSLPAYAPDGGDPHFATGRVFVTFASATREDWASLIAAEGFIVLSTPKYAPNSAWIGRADGDVGAALARLGNLSKLAAIESVQPQLLSTRSHK